MKYKREGEMWKGSLLRSTRRQCQKVETVRGYVALVLVTMLALIPVAVARADGTDGDELLFLPVVQRELGSTGSNCEVANTHYTTLPISGSPSDRPAATHPDLNLAVRGWKANSDALRLVNYGPTEDAKAPRLYTLFGDRRVPSFTDGWEIYGWDWNCMCRVDAERLWEPTLLGLRTALSEIIYTPDSGYDIGGGYDALVLFASPSQLTLKYTREDNVVRGYTIHIEEICVEPDLLALYERANASGRGSLPALRGGQPLGTANTGEIRVAIRDSGSFMDPRSQQDWWQR